jgi:hypothetical protein
MASMFEKLQPSNPEREVSHDDVEDWIHADKGIVQSRTVADGALIDAVMNPDPEIKTLDNESFRRINRHTEYFVDQSCRRVFYTPEVRRKPAMLPGTGSDATTYNFHLQIIYIITDRVTISSNRCPTKTILHFY